jgi:hypothetical protein
MCAMEKYSLHLLGPGCSIEEVGHVQYVIWLVTGLATQV